MWEFVVKPHAVAPAAARQREPPPFPTVDRWDTPEDFGRTCETSKAEYAQLDRAFDELKESERPLDVFVADTWA